ncbi:hypothetical protein ATE80_29940 [Streptomyces kanasensis]|uniref:Bacterial transcriptional activator domain-containing protein n=1 Tax=Streptomyces kanasensis TaxID=936756 RepID=A0A100Y086_9ACTN|nr:hypothetical protein ATE80_29940 [Streptomyces kanasensis]
MPRPTCVWRRSSPSSPQERGQDRPAVRRASPSPGPGPRAWEYESWTDDLERAVVALSHQNFAFADDLLRRWSSTYRPSDLDERGTYLLARSIALQGDLKRDQGAVVGPLSAQRGYTTARSLYTELATPRRVAQLDLSLSVATEMSGALETAARQYEDLAIDVIPTRPCPCAPGGSEPPSARTATTTTRSG